MRTYLIEISEYQRVMLMHACTMLHLKPPTHFTEEDREESELLLDMLIDMQLSPTRSGDANPKDKMVHGFCY